jgi:hypothetical protein
MQGWASVVNGGVSVELGLSNYIVSYRRFQSRDNPSGTIIIIHLLWFCQKHHPPATVRPVYENHLTHSTVALVELLQDGQQTSS